MKVLKFIAEATGYIATTAICLTLIAACVYLIELHFTCSSFFNTCVIH